MRGEGKRLGRVGINRGLSPLPRLLLSTFGLHCPGVEGGFYGT